MTALLSASGLRVYRGDRCLFSDVGFALPAGQMLVVAGANGSGKTSLLRTIAGLLEPDAGELLWRGRSTRSEAQRFRGELGWLAHRLGLKSDLTVAENLQFDAGLRGVPAPGNRQEGMSARLGLAGLESRPVRALSAGQQRRVALARLIASGSTLWLMDEPFTHLDSAGQDLVTDVLAEHLGGGGVAVVATHHPIELPVTTHRLQLQ